MEVFYKLIKSVVFWEIWRKEIGLNPGLKQRCLLGVQQSSRVITQKVHFFSCKSTPGVSWLFSIYSGCFGRHWAHQHLAAAHVFSGMWCRTAASQSSHLPNVGSHCSFPSLPLRADALTKIFTSPLELQTHLVCNSHYGTVIMAIWRKKINYFGDLIIITDIQTFRRKGRGNFQWGQILFAESESKDFENLR